MPVRVLRVGKDGVTCLLSPYAQQFRIGNALARSHLDGLECVRLDQRLAQYCGCARQAELRPALLPACQPSYSLDVLDHVTSYMIHEILRVGNPSTLENIQQSPDLSIASMVLLEA